MESRQFYISVSEGVYDSWRAIGVLEGLHTDGDVGQFLVTWYSSQKQREGGESGLRCVHCHSPLSLHCTACHPPSLLTLPPHPPSPSLTSPPPPHLPSPSLTSPPPPHLPSPSLSSPPLPHPSSPSLSSPPPPHLASPSLSSPPPPHLASPSLSSPPPSLPPQDVDRPDFVTDAENVLASDSDPMATNGSGVKDEESDNMLQDGGDQDSSTFDLGTVKEESAFSICDNELKTAVPDVGSSVTMSAGGERRKSQRLTRKSATTSDRSEQKRAAPVGQIDKPLKRKHSDRSVTATNSTNVIVKGEKKTADGMHSQMKNPISKKSAENVPDNNKQKKVKGTDNASFAKKQNQRERRRKPCASQDLEDGFVLPSEMRNSAQIHMYDESFYDNHKIEDEPPKRPGRPKKNVTKPAILMKQGRTKHTRKQRNSSTASYSDSCSSDDDISNVHQDLCVEQDVLFSKKDIRTENEEMEESDKQPLRILVSAQKILPLRTTTGNYAHNFYSYFECIHCKKAFVHKRAFNSHVQTHMDPKLFKCTLCGKGFKRSCDRIKHERRHNFECSICGKKYSDNNELNEHLKLHTENNGVIKCSGCAFESSDFHEYEKHRSKCTVVQCEVCGVRLKSRFALKFHISAVHENDRPYKCTLCEKSFVLQTNLNSHMKYRHAEGGRTFHCDQCDYRAFDARALSIHQRCLHSNERPFKCTYCPSAFARKFYLVVHLRKHTGEKPHRCTECSQSFAQKPSLTRHRRTHHGLESTGHKKMAEQQTSTRF